VSKPVDVVLVTAAGCHFCDEAGRLLDELGQLTPLAVRTVPLASDEGRSLLVRHRVPFPPILLVDGAFFGYGRISRRKLSNHLAGLGDDVAV
jgi:hypothetical protein